MLAEPLQHAWDVSPSEAIEIQRRLRPLLVVEDRFDKIEIIAGVDVGFEDQGQTTRAAVVSLSFPGLRTLGSAVSRRPTQFPYIPGLLSFREIPAVMQALKLLSGTPDMLLVDGQGIAHPRRLGIAAHLGLLTDIPSIGVGKSRLCGTHAQVPDEKGAWVSLKDGDEIIGAVVRSRQGVKPIYVSPGHRVGLESAIHYVMAAVTRYKLPETTRAADRLASYKPGREKQLHMAE